MFICRFCPPTEAVKLEKLPSSGQELPEKLSLMLIILELHVGSIVIVSCSFGDILTFGAIFVTSSYYLILALVLPKYFRRIFPGIANSVTCTEKLKDLVP